MKVDLTGPQNTAKHITGDNEYQSGYIQKPPEVISEGTYVANITLDNEVQLEPVLQGPITEAVAICKQNELGVTKTQTILKEFQNYFDVVTEWETKAVSLTITREDQTAEMAMADTGRKFLKKLRNEIETKRKALKEDALKEGKTIDGIANILKGIIEPTEKFLTDQSNYLLNKENERRIALRTHRELLLTPYGVDLTFYDLINMPEPDFLNLLDSLRIISENKLKAEKELQELNELIRLKNERKSKRMEEFFKMGLFFNGNEFYYCDTDRVLIDDIVNLGEQEFIIFREQTQLRKDEHFRQLDQQREMVELAAKEKKIEDDKREAELKRIKAENDAIQKKIADQQKVEADRLKKEEEKRIAEKKAEELRIQLHLKKLEKLAAAPDREKLLALCSAVDNLINDSRPVLTSLLGDSMFIDFQGTVNAAIKELELSISKYL